MHGETVKYQHIEKLFVTQFFSVTLVFQEFFPWH